MSSRLSVCILLCLLGVVQAQEPSEAPLQPVITTIAGPLLTYYSAKPEQLAGAVRDMSRHGDVLWVLIPTWSKDILNFQPEIERARQVIELCHSNDMAVAFMVSWHSLLPRGEELEACPWAGETLDPNTGEFKRAVRWDLGSEDAHAEFEKRVRRLFELIGGPVEMYVQDEVIVGSAGKNFWYQRISTYWTGATFSERSLRSFREYLAARGYPKADEARFPVTTTAKEASSEANEGLPAIPLNATNNARLQEDNDWPDSDLWRHWYAWREDLYARWLGTITTAAAEAWGGSPDWRGCFYVMPATWAVTGLAQNLDKIARLNHMDCICSGYMSGTNFEKFKVAAERAGKRWGITVELAHYGKQKGVDVAHIENVFKAGVEAGAAIVNVYPGTAFRIDRKEPRESGLYYMPEQIATWDKCREWPRELPRGE